MISLLLAHKVAVDEVPASPGLTQARWTIRLDANRACAQTRSRWTMYRQAGGFHCTGAVFTGVDDWRNPVPARLSPVRTPGVSHQARVWTQDIQRGG